MQRSGGNALQLMDDFDFVMEIFALPSFINNDGEG